MTVIEFLHSIPIKNMVSCLSFCPNKVIFLGNGKAARIQVAQYKKILAEKGFLTQTEFVNIEKKCAKGYCLQA